MKKTNKSRSKRPTKILVAHDNKTDGHTTKAHKFAERIDKMPDFKTIVDKDVWRKGEKTSSSETDKREKDMVKKADIIVRIVASPTKTGRKRGEGAQREVRKAIYAGKPVIEIFEPGAKDKPNRPESEKNYKKRVPIHLKPFQPLESGLKEGIKQLEKKKIKLNEKTKQKKKSTTNNKKSVSKNISKVKKKATRTSQKKYTRKKISSSYKQPKKSSRSRNLKTNQKSKTGKRVSKKRTK